MTRRKVLSFLLGLGAACTGWAPSFQARFEQEHVRLLKLVEEKRRLWVEAEMNFIRATPEERERMRRALPSLLAEIVQRNRAFGVKCMGYPSA